MLLFLAGCSLKEVFPDPVTYTIVPLWQTQTKRLEKVKECAGTIKVAPVRGTRPFTSTELLYTDSDYGQNSYNSAQWSDSPLRLLQTLFQVTLDQSGLYCAVIPATSFADADFLLESTLLDLSHQVKDGGASEGVVRVRFHLVDVTGKRVVKTRELVRAVPASSLDAKGGAAAINQAAQTVTSDLVAWLSESAATK